MKKNKIPLPRLGLVALILIACVIKLNNEKIDYLDTQVKWYYDRTESIRNIGIKTNTVEYENKKEKEEQIEIAEAVHEEKVEEITEPVVEEVEEIQEEPVVEATQEETQYATQYTTRMTSFYPAESSDCTGSGLCSWDFQVNENGWFTYQGKLVVATATEYLLKYGFSLADGVHTYNYYDEITLNIDGVDYQAIVLDSCGSSMQTDRIDLFVSGDWAVKDTQIIVKE